MTPRIAIIGNGPSRELYDVAGREYDVVIGTNFPAHKVDYSAFVDCFAARNFRKGASHHNRLGEFKLLLGQRAWNLLHNIKDVPGGTSTLAEWLMDSGHVEDIVTYPDYVLGTDDSQRFMTSGHLAFMWATDNYRDADIDIYGCDSLFIGNQLVSHTQQELSGKPLNRVVLDEPTDAVKVWADYWEFLLNDQTYNKVTFIGYADDPDLIVKHGDVNVERFEKPTAVL